MVFSKKRTYWFVTTESGKDLKFGQLLKSWKNQIWGQFWVILNL